MITQGEWCQGSGMCDFHLVKIYSVCLCVHVRLKNREELCVAKQQDDKVRERWCDWEKPERWRNVEWDRGDERKATGDLGCLMILPEGHRQCWRGWVEYVSTRHCVKHWRNSHALWKWKKKSFTLIAIGWLEQGRTHMQRRTLTGSEWN